jgi:ribokinase
LKLLLKLGSSGSIYIDENNNIFKQKTFLLEDMPIVDTTGAGDCFTASFTTQLLENKPIKECLLYATCAAYCCITKFGTFPSLPTKEEVVNVLNRVQNLNN